MNPTPSNEQMDSLFVSLFPAALQRRERFIQTLHEERTNAYRLFHGVAEGLPGLTLDRYNELLLLQTFRDPLSEAQIISIENELRKKISYPFRLIYNHRGKAPTESFAQWHQPSAEALEEIQCQEQGLDFYIRGRHQGIDPWLFLDLRAGRRIVFKTVKDLSVLNLFAYTCSVGVTAAKGGAREVWNVDFSNSSLEVGRRNAELNQIPEERFKLIQEDCLPVMRQLAGLPVGLRNAKARPYLKVEARQFDLVFLDPPAWSKGPFGAVDVVGDYPTLFKSAVLATKPGGRVIATNHIAKVALDSWVDGLKRCAAKAGRALRSVETVSPDEDFPSSDGQHPLKTALCEVS